MWHRIKNGVCCQGFLYVSWPIFYLAHSVKMSSGSILDFTYNSAAKGCVRDRSLRVEMMYTWPKFSRIPFS